MHPHEAWPPVYEKAGRRLADVLCQMALKIDCDTFHQDFQERLEAYYTDRERDLVETTTSNLLKNLLVEKGNHELSENLLRSALDEFYRVTQANWILEEDAIPTLAALRSSGLRLALISNAGDHSDVLQLIQKFQIQDYFDFILTSASTGYRKPHPKMFEDALLNWNLMPDEVAMIGDKLEADIVGARPLGIFTIWVQKHVVSGVTLTIHPDATIHKLEEILKIPQIIP